MRFPLTDSLEKEDGRRDGDVERVELSQHRYAYVGIGSLTPLLRQPRVFRTHDDGGGTAHIGVVIEAGVLQLSRQNLHAVFL